MVTKIGKEHRRTNKEMIRPRGNYYAKAKEFVKLILKINKYDAKEE